MSESSDNFPLWAIPAIPIAFILLWSGVCYVLAFVSGWRRLALHYKAPAEPTGHQFLFRSGMVGPVNYRNALHFAAAKGGLFVWVLLPVRLGSSRLFIPWPEIAAAIEKSWMFDYVVLTFSKAPRVRMRLRRHDAEAIAAASDQTLEIGAKER